MLKFQVDTLIAIGLLLLGFTVLIVGGEALVRAAVSLALRFKVSAATVGLTVVAAGTSAPELLTSVIASFKDSPDIAVGNIVGSNIFNLLAILGLAAILQPIIVSKRLFKKELLLLIGFSFLFVLLTFDGWLKLWEGCFLLLCLIGSILFTLRTSKKEIQHEDDDIKPLKSVAWDMVYLVTGMVALVQGADWAIEGGVRLGEICGLSQRTIGIVIISAGTGLPELATSAVAAMKKQNDIAFANVVGSNMMNLLAVGGVASILKPMPIADAIINFDNYIMIGATLIVVPVVLFGKYRIPRSTGFLFLVIYSVYVVGLLVREAG